MIGNLQDSFEELLDNEAIRIMGNMLIMYEKKVKTNKNFEYLVRDLAKENYSYFWVELMIRVKKFLPNNLCEDLTGEYALVTKEEHREQHLTGYEDFCKRLKSKKHIKVSEQMADILIEYCIINPTCNEDLLQLIVKNMFKVMPEHNDSVDSRVILMYLQQDITKKGFIITNLDPLRIEQTKKG